MASMLSRFCLLLLCLWAGARGPGAQTTEPPGAAAGTSGTLEPASTLWEEMAHLFEPPPEFAGDLGRYASLLEFHDGSRVLEAADWPRRRQEILDQWQELLGPWPARIERPRLEELARERREDLTQLRVELETAPGQVEPAYLLVPDGPGPFPAVLVLYYDPESSVGLGGVELRDFGFQLARRGFVTLSLGSPGGDARHPPVSEVRCQPLSFLAYVAANCWNALAVRPEVDASRIGVVGHSYGGKWAMFAAALDERFACGVWSDPGIVFDESRPNVNYWEPWYLGYDPGRTRTPGVPTPANPRTGPYARMIERGLDLHEVQALLAPRPFLVSGGSEDPPERWRALNHIVAVNALLGQTHRVAMSNRPGHTPTPESNEQIYRFLDFILQP